MRIIHISDIHLGNIFKKKNYQKTNLIISDAVENGFDHLVITGDISDNSEKQGFEALKRILKNFDIYDSKKVTITIGNHDIFGGVQTAEDIIGFPLKCRNTDFNKKIENFFDSFSELFKGAEFPEGGFKFPFIKKIGELALIGINTIDEYSRIKNPFASNGKVGKRQREDLKKFLSREDIRQIQKIILSHHHFYKNTEEAESPQRNLWDSIESYTLRLRKKKVLIKLFAEYGINLVLHGHSHEMRDYQRSGIRFINGGASVDNKFKNAAYYNIINIESNSINKEIKKLKLKRRFASLRQTNFIGKAAAI